MLIGIIFGGKFKNQNSITTTIQSASCHSSPLLALICGSCCPGVWLETPAGFSMFSPEAKLEDKAPPLLAEVGLDSVLLSFVLPLLGFSPFC